MIWQPAPEKVNCWKILLGDRWSNVIVPKESWSLVIGRVLAVQHSLRLQLSSWQDLTKRSMSWCKLCGQTKSTLLILTQWDTITLWLCLEILSRPAIVRLTRRLLYPTSTNNSTNIVATQLAYKMPINWSLTISLIHSAHVIFTTVISFLKERFLCRILHLFQQSCQWGHASSSRVTIQWEWLSRWVTPTRHFLKESKHVIWR